MRSRGLLCCLLVFSSPVFAQDPPPSAGSGEVELFPRYDFWMSAEHLSGDDPRFVWDTSFSGGLDVVRYRDTRLSFLASYQAMLGEQYRSFDPNQSNYTLEGTLMTRIGDLVVGPVVYHQSRHLSDRFKDEPVDWNMAGGRVAGLWERGPARLDSRVDLRGVFNKTYVDYQWELDAGVRAQYRLHPRVAVVGGANLRRLGVDGSRNRGDQTGFRSDGGVRIEGTAAAMEFFLAAERRIDPYQLQFGTVTWASVGMRLLSR